MGRRIKSTPEERTESKLCLMALSCVRCRALTPICSAVAHEAMVQVAHEAGWQRVEIGKGVHGLACPDCAKIPVGAVTPPPSPRKKPAKRRLPIVQEVR